MTHTRIIHVYNEKSDGKKVSIERRIGNTIHLSIAVSCQISLLMDQIAQRQSTSSFYFRDVRWQHKRYHIEDISIGIYLDYLFILKEMHPDREIDLRDKRNVRRT